MAKRLSEYLSNYFNYVSYIDMNEDRIYSFLSEADNEMMLIYIEFEKLEDIYVSMLKRFIESRTEVFVFSNQKSLNRISTWVDFFCKMPAADENDIKDVESFCYIMFIFQIFILEYLKINRGKIKKRFDAIENLKTSIKKAPY